MAGAALFEEIPKIMYLKDVYLKHIFLANFIMNFISRLKFKSNMSLTVSKTFTFVQRNLYKEVFKIAKNIKSIFQSKYINKNSREIPKSLKCTK